MRNLIIKSAMELTREQKVKLETGLKEKLNDDLDFSYQVDGIVGGIIIIDGENFVDASMSTELMKLKKATEEMINEMHAKGNVKTKELPNVLKAKLNEFLIHEPNVGGLKSKEVPGLIKSKLSQLITRELNVNVCGKVVKAMDGIIKIEGLSTCQYGELLLVGKENYAIAMNLEVNSVGAMLLNDPNAVEYGDIVYTTGKIVEVPVGETLLGRVINPLGEPIDGMMTLHAEKTRRIEHIAPGIIDRDKVNQPLMTGILAIDSMIPIGKGQRELIIGDRQTGKTSIAIDTIINQRGKNVICIYVAIGQRASSISKIIRTLKENEAFDYTIIVVSTADDSAPLQYIAPYTGCAIAEEFMENGKDVLIIYDDLSKHAIAYRAISLLLKRPAGREAYPGDVFYIHSKLLERSAKLSKEKGGGSMTALPIIETLAGDISAYIPTNVISITDGQIYLETELFNSGIRPAVNVGLSVSRVGGAAQCPAIRKLSSKLRLDLAHYRELAVFSQFGSDLDNSTKDILIQGKKTTEALKQMECNPMEMLRQVLCLFVITNKFLTDIKNEHVSMFLEGFYKYVTGSLPTESKQIRTTGVLTDELKDILKNSAKDYVSYFKTEKSYSEG